MFVFPLTHAHTNSINDTVNYGMIIEKVMKQQSRQSKNKKMMASVTLYNLS